MDCGVRSLKCDEARNGKCGVESVKGEVESVKCGACSVDCGRIWSLEGGENMECGVWSGECRAESGECEV